MATWRWSPLADEKLGQLLNAPMSALVNYLGLAEKVHPRQDVFRTTDATVAVLHTEKIPVDTSVLVVGGVVARRTGGSAGAANDGAGYVVEFAAKNTAGTAALLAAATVRTTGESQAGWNVTVVATGGDVLVKVTGALDNNIVWAWTGKTLSVKE